MKTLMAGPQGVFPPGSVVDLDAGEAEAMIAAGYAERIDHPVETAAVEPGSRAVKTAPRPRKAV